MKWLIRYVEGLEQHETEYESPSCVKAREDFYLEHKQARIIFCKERSKIMKKLNKVYRATINRYNFKEPFITYVKDFDNYPTEEELLKYLLEMNEDDRYRDSETTIIINKIYKITNTELLEQNL